MGPPGATVVVTGIGVLCGLGDSIGAVHEALCAGHRGLRRRPADDLVPQLTVADLADFAPADYLGAANFRPLDRTSQLAACAARLALDDSGWTPDLRSESELGLVLGTMFGSLGTISAFDRRGLTAGPSYVKPFQFANSVINAAAGQTAIWHDLRGVNATISGDTASGLQALGYAADLIRSGRARALLAGGVEEICSELLWGFDRRGQLAENGDGETFGAVPWHRRRSGFTPGEAAVLLMLEDEGAARHRGAAIIARIDGYATAFDPAAETDEGAAGELIARVIGEALDDAGRAAADVACVSASASGSPVGDRLEARGLASAGLVAPATAVKSALGDSLGAGGALQTAVAIASLRSGRLPGVTGLDEPEPGLGVDAAATARDLAPAPGSACALIHSRGFDGASAALVVGAPAEETR